MLPINREKLAWAAGFFDGEGYIGCSPTRRIGRKKPRRNIQIAVTQGNVGQLERFRAAVGEIGRIYLQARPSDPQRAAVWVWKGYSFESVQAVVAMLWPWLGTPKRQQATRALAAYHDFVDERFKK